VGKLKKADAYYDKLSYSYAVGLYEELIGSEVDGPELLAKIAKSYYYIGNMEKAETYFTSMINTDMALKEDFFFYAQALKQNGKYAESDQWMAKFNQLASSDARGLSFINNTSYLDKIEKQGIHFELQFLSG
jgi:tetratricopeptide (TPR) repeat protein